MNAARTIRVISRLHNCTSDVPTLTCQGAEALSNLVRLTGFPSPQNNFILMLQPEQVVDEADGHMVICLHAKSGVILHMQPNLGRH